MSTSISTAFIKQFEREVHETYQRQGSKLRGGLCSGFNRCHGRRHSLSCPPCQPQLDCRKRPVAAIGHHVFYKLVE